MSADFNQYTGSTFDKSAGIDFSLSNMSYDANGNIKTMNQNGLKINNSPPIDQLTYTYQNNSNKLSQVLDVYNDKDSKLGDFKYDPATKGTTDYSYDANGNLIADANKKISSITYNYLNLPSVITVTGKGTITYTYDAAGNKLKKVTQENNATVPFNDANYTSNITATTTYIGGVVYETKTYSNASLASFQYTDELQFMAHEEGRIRPIRDDNNNITSFTYDYFLKDHLGNVRMVLTEEQKTDHYPTATLEGAGAGSPVVEEQEYYDINSSFVVDKPTNVSPSNLLDYINDNGTNNPSTFGNRNAVSEKMYRLNAATNRTGYSRILKVMAGDKIDILAKSYYHYSGGSIQKNNLLAADIINAFISVTGGGNAAVQHGANTTILNNNTTGLVFPLDGFSNGNPDNLSNNVKAGLSYVILDEQFNFVTGNYDPVNGNSSGGLKNHFFQAIDIQKNGYIYVYCSNESNIDVFFDNLEVITPEGRFWKRHIITHSD